MEGASGEERWKEMKESKEGEEGSTVNNFTAILSLRGNTTDSPVTYMVEDFAFSWLSSMFALLNDVHVSPYKSDVL